MSLLLARRGTIGRASTTLAYGTSAGVVLTQPIESETAAAASISPALGVAPTAGNLLLVAAYGGGVTDLTATGLTRVVIATSGTAATALFVTVAAGGEPASWTVDADVSGSLRAEIMEWSPGAGVTWAPTDLVVASATTTGTGFSGTMTADVETGGPTFAVAAMGIGPATFDRAWTGGFTWDGETLDRFTAATYISAGAETLSTTESWDTSRQYRGALAAFRLV